MTGKVWDVVPPKRVRRRIRIEVRYEPAPWLSQLVIWPLSKPGVTRLKPIPF